jgi:phage I-like protein
MRTPMTKKFSNKTFGSKSKKLVTVFPFEFNENGKGADAKVAIPDTIQLLPIGQWEHELYGDIIIKDSDIQEFVQNFDAGIRKGVFITAGHEGFQELPAVAWIKSVEARGDGLYGQIDWTNLGKSILEDKQFKFFSPEYCSIYEDPETHEVFRNVLTGGALTKSPYFKELDAVVFCDPEITRKFNESNNTMLILEDVLKKAPADLNDAEKAFLKEHEAELSDEQKVEFATALEVKTEEVAETEEAKTARLQKEQEDANEANGLNRDGSAKEQVDVNASAKPVTMSFGEHAALKDAADKGKIAMAKLEKQELDTAVSSLIFSEGNKAGRFLPKDQTLVTTFMAGLTAEKKLAFASLVKQIPLSAAFKELGAGDGANAGDPVKELELKTTELMKDGKMSYADAVKKVFSDNEGFQDRYETHISNQ